MRKFLIFNLILAVVAVFLGCGDDDDNSKWVGRWEVSSFDSESYIGDGVMYLRNDWIFVEDGSWHWNLEYILDDGHDIKHIEKRFRGIYGVSSDNFVLAIQDELSIVDGVATVELPGRTAIYEVDKGTWRISGDQLFLITNLHELVFKRK